MTASYLQNNDYTALQMRRPYQLPINDIAQTVSTLDSYWKQGAARVKAQYENIAGLNLTLDSNKEYVNNYLKEAQNQLKKLSTKDLSDISIQQEGLNLFKPVLSDNKILKDHAITNLRQSVISEAQMYKTKDGGKGYADENLIDALNKFSDFKADTDPNQLDSIYEKAKSARYVPYYDIQKEMIMLRDKCGELEGQSVNAAQTKQGTYDIITSGTPSSKIRGCLETLSPQANVQLGITGRVRYGGDYQALGKDLLMMNNDLKKRYTSDIAELEGAISSKKIGKGENERSLTAEEIQALSERKSLTQTRLNEITAQNAKLEANDFSDIQLNYDNYAGNVFKRKTIDAFADSFYTSKTEYEANTFDVMRQAQEYALQKISFAASEKAKYDAAAKEEENKKLSTPETVMGSDQGMEKAGYSYNELQDKVKGWNAEMNSALVSTFAHIQAMSGGNKFLEDLTGKLKTAIGTNNKIDNQAELNAAYGFLKTYYDTATKDKNQQAISIIKDGFNQLAELQEQITGAKTLIDAADAKVKQQVGEFYNRKSLNQEYKESIKINNSVVITPNDIQDAIEGKSTKGLYVVDIGLGKKALGVRENQNLYSGIIENGVILPATKLGELFNSIYNKNYKVFEKANEVRNKFLTEEVASQYLKYDYNKTEKGINFKSKVALTAGISTNQKDEKLHEKVNILPTFRDGVVDVQLVGLDPDELEKALVNFEKIATPYTFGGQWEIIDKKAGIIRMKGVRDFDDLNQYGDLTTLRQRISLQEKPHEKLKTRIGTQGKEVTFEYNKDANMIYIKESGVVVGQPFPKSNIVDALMLYNSLIK